MFTYTNVHLFKQSGSPLGGVVGYDENAATAVYPVLPEFQSKTMKEIMSMDEKNIVITGPKDLSKSFVNRRIRPYNNDPFFDNNDPILVHQTPTGKRSDGKTCS